MKEQTHLSSKTNTDLICPSIEKNYVGNRTLPLINFLKENLRDLNLQKILIISVQHLCSTTEVLFNALIEKKLSPKNLYVLGKCYSTNPSVLNSLIKKGVQASFSSLHFENEISYDKTFNTYIDQMLNKILASVDLLSFEKILVLDDGGHLLERANDLLPNSLPIVGVEQTSSGYNRLKNKNLSFPVINLARSKLKLEKESPLIIDLVIRKLNEKVFFSNFLNKRILIIGNGTLGKKVYESFKNTYSINVYDSDPTRSQISNKDFRKEISKYDLIIGCSGEKALRFEDFQYLKKPVVLASISSSDREFEAEKLRKIQPQKNCHNTINVNNITLLNCGFPITFDEDYDAIDTDEYQLTRGLIYISLYQGTKTNQKYKGFINLHKNLEFLLLRGLESNE